jgi:hypothetical protein
MKRPAADIPYIKPAPSDSGDDTGNDDSDSTNAND